MEENKKDVLPLEGEPLTTPQISEPVVNALAAALNKIETYVPTQYINDGPPDIDAEHLNHAEQAIMRVTNLANGAADAISALQSQVTQLNSDLAVSFYDIPQPADNDIFTFDTWEFRCLRSGNIVTLKINIGGNMKAISDFIDLLTLDSKYKPFNYNIIHNYVTQQGKPMILNILANGTVRLWNMNTSISDGWICRQCITYVTNS